MENTDYKYNSQPLDHEIPRCERKPDLPYDGDGVMLGVLIIWMVGLLVGIGLGVMFARIFA